MIQLSFWTIVWAAAIGTIIGQVSMVVAGAVLKAISKNIPE